MTPIIPWVGSKRALLPVLRQWFRVAFDRWVEPFAGSLAAFLDLRPARALLGDANAGLIEMYERVRDDPEGVCAAIARLELSREGYVEIRDMDPESVAALSQTARAARFIFLRAQGFNGLVRENSSGANNVAFGGRLNPRRLLALQQKIRGASAALRTADIRVADFGKTLAEVGPGDLCLLDPPYLGRHSQYVAAGFTIEDHRRLARLALEAHERGAKLVVTHGDSKEIRELYSGPPWRLQEMPIRRNLAAKGADRRAVVELLFANFNRPVAISAPQLQAVNMSGGDSVTEPAIVQAERKMAQRGQRLTESVVQERCAFVRELVQGGMGRPEILRGFRERYGDVATRTVDGYLRRVREGFLVDAVAPESLGKRRAAERDSFLAKLEQDVAECKSAGVWSALVGLRRLQADVAGLRILRPAEPPQAPSLTQNTLILNLTETERAHRVALLERVLERQRRQSALDADAEPADEPDAAGE